MKNLFILFLLFTVSTFAQSIPSYVPTNGLLGWWPFSGSANDESGNGKHGSIVNTDFSLDRFGNPNSAANFDQNGDVINLPEISTALGAPNSSATYSVWFKGAPTTANYGFGPVLSASTTFGGNAYRISIETTSEIAPFYTGKRIKVYYRCQNENDEPTDSLTYIPTDWNNVIAVVDANSNQYKLYVNGVLNTSLSFQFNSQNNYYHNTRAWQIGAIIPSPSTILHQFIGQIDDIGIWNRALSPQEISSLYQGCTDSVEIQPTNFSAFLNPGWANFVCKSSDTSATYQWQQSSGAGWINLQNLGNFSGTNSDSLIISGITNSMNNYGYRCIVNGCQTDTSDVAILTVSNGIGLSENPLNNLSFSPNPTSGFIHLNNSLSGTYELMASDGRVIESGDTKMDFDLSQMPNGIYNLRIQTSEGIKVLKIFKL